MKNIYLISIFNVDRSWGLSTYTHNLQSLYKKKWHKSITVTPYTGTWLQNLLISIWLLTTKFIYLLNKTIWLKCYYKACVFSIKHQLKNIKTEDVVFHFQDVVALRYSDYSQPTQNLLTLHWDISNMNLSDKIVKKNSSAFKYVYQLESQAYKVAKKIIAVDKRLYTHAIRMWANKQDTLAIANFTNTDYFTKPKVQEVHELCKKLNIDQNKNIIFCPRRMVEKNGVIYAIDVISQLSEEYLLIITWVWQEKEKIEKKIQKLWISSKIKITWDIDHSSIVDYYRLSDLTIVPSITSSWVIEATSISAIESLACWVPIVASSIWWLTEIIQHWYNGYLCEEKNTHEFVKSIETFFLLNMTRKEKMKENARVSANTNFSADSYYNKLITFLWK